MNAASDVGPVRAHDRVNDVLARDDALVDLFVRHSGHFNKLRNRAMRRVMGRLVTVEDAARLAAVPVENLLRDLNAALGFKAVAAAADTASSAPHVGIDRGTVQRPADAAELELDVRDDLRAGREPLARIMATVSALPEDAVLHLRTIFEPVPLLALLGRRGFASETTEHGTDDWSSWFWRDAATAASGDASSEVARDASVARRPTTPAPVGVTTPHARVTLDERTSRWLDVRGLQPPEPLMRTLAALESLPRGHTLVHVNDRVPQLLLPMLAERGFACELDESLADRVLLRIWHHA